ncbi:MAG: beta-mannosidase [Armatimonadota bacterium]
MQIFSLNGDWNVSSESMGPIPAQVPGCVHADLLAAGKIEDPYYRDNEDRLQWIGETDWTYSRRFAVPAELLAHDRVLLRCEGLDTLATVTLNGRAIARTDNMYRTWEFDVKDALVPGENVITVHFASTLPYIASRQQECRLPDWCPPREPKGRAWVRKEPCNYGWDWGPVLITCGIWRDIALVAFDTARLTDVQVRQRHTPGTVALTVTATAEQTGDAELTVEVTAAYAGRPVAVTTATLRDGTASTALIIDDPQLWWPNDMGGQPLYDVTVALKREDDVLDTMTRRIGLRTLELHREPDEWGESFRFVVNGVPFFAKGANWIPADAMITRLTRDHYARLLRSAADAHMNMLRVWGGGVYEQEWLYDLCDELGLCVWQDFMFACSTYPTFDDEFMHNVRAEQEDAVRRLRHHACLALWCGNNELEMGLVGQAWNDRHMSWAEYGNLFDVQLPDTVKALDPDRSYWPGSPHSPIGNRDDHSNPSCGDAHLWDVWHGKQPFEWYRTCTHRFASEFGFQSFPEPKTVCHYTAPQDYNITSYVMEHHQRSGIGNTTIISYMLDWFRVPSTFEMSLWLSQILQGMAMKYAVENWRRHMPRTMGTLYWQLNDCWPVASWSSIDYFGRWKALHHMAKAFYAPLLVSGVENTDAGTVELHVTSDLQEPKTGTISWELTDLHGAVLVGAELSVEIAPQANLLASTLALKEALRLHGTRNLLLWLVLTVDGKRISTNLVNFARPKHLELPDPGITAAVEEAGGGHYTVTLTTERPALWAWLELEQDEARCSENFVHLRPGHPVVITLTPATPISLERVQGQLRVRSLVDTYRTEWVAAMR